jgi:hypothetical protein
VAANGLAGSSLLLIYKITYFEWGISSDITMIICQKTRSMHTLPVDQELPFISLLNFSG